jgi:hypothetical protein
MTPAMKMIGAAAGIGLVGGIVAERMTSGKAIQRNADAQVWNKLHEDFLKRHPVPGGVLLHVGTEPAWKNAALVGGAAAGVAALGGGLAFAASKMTPQNFPLFVAGMGVAALGTAAAAGAGASWAIR